MAVDEGVELKEGTEYFFPARRCDFLPSPDAEIG